MPFSLSPRIPDTDGPRSQATFTIRVNGLALARTYQVLAVRVQKEANRIPTAHLVFKDGDTATGTFALSDQPLFVPGSQVEILAGYLGRPEKLLFKGLVVKHAIEGRSSAGTSRLTVTCKDAFVKTTLAPQRRVFNKKTDSQAAQAIVGRYAGLAVQAAPTRVVHPQLLQYDATDWDFLQLRAAANGQLCLVDDGRLTLAAPRLSQAPVVSLQYGATVLAFDAEMDARDQATTLTTSAWDPAKGATAQAKAMEPVGPDTFGNVGAKTLAGALGVAQVLRHDGALPPAELQAWADSALSRRRLAKIRGRIQFYGNAAVKPGTVLKISGLGKRFSGLAYVSGVSHRLENGGWLTDAQLGLDPRTLAPAGAAGAAPVSAPPAGGLLPALHGLQIGVVTALGGDPAGEERIAVRLSLLDPAADGTRARIVSVDAGKDRGFFFRPEVGDEVVVGFLHNDPRQAVVLGALHGSRHPVPAPFKTEDANNKKGYVSRSKLQVVFDDDKKTLTLTTPGGNLLRLDDAAKGITLQDQHGNKIVLGQDGISIESSKALTVKATTDAKLSAQGVELAAQAQFKATGSAGVEMSSSATAVLKGATVMIN